MEHTWLWDLGLIGHPFVPQDGARLTLLKVQHFVWCDGHNDDVHDFWECLRVQPLHNWHRGVAQPHLAVRAILALLRCMMGMLHCFLVHISLCRLLSAWSGPLHEPIVAHSMMILCFVMIADRPFQCAMDKCTAPIASMGQ